MSGFLFNLQLMGAPVFVDHHSDHVYIYLMRNLTLEETLLAKDVYGQFLNSNSASVHAYHADNGRFVDKRSGHDYRSSNQIITFLVLEDIIRMGLPRGK